MKKMEIKVPFIKGLQNMDYNSLEVALENDGAKGTIANVNWPKEFPYQPDCFFTIARSESHIAVSFHVRGFDLRAASLEDDGNIWEDSCCEFFVENPKESKYCNFEINCIGRLLNGLGSGRNDRERRSPEVLKRIIRFSSLEPREYNEKDSLFNWGVAMVIPFDLIGIDPNNIPDRLKANFYKCGDLTKHPHFLSWNPVGCTSPDFHRPEFFGELIFEN